MKHLILIIFIIFTADKSYSQVNEIEAVKEKFNALFEGKNLVSRQTRNLIPDVLSFSRIHYKYGLMSPINPSKRLLKNLGDNSGLNFIVKEEISKYDGGVFWLLIPKELNEDYDSYKKRIQSDKEILNNLPKAIYADTTITAYVADEGLNIQMASLQGIAFSEIANFSKFIAYRNSHNTPISNLFDLKNNSNIEIKGKPRVSDRGYPYYGNVSIKLLDTQNNELGSYGYVYDSFNDSKPGDELHRAELKAIVSVNRQVNKYEIYCDGMAVDRILYKSEYERIYHEGQSLATGIFTGLFQGLWENDKLASFEKELFFISQQKICLYSENIQLKNTVFAEISYKAAKEKVKNKEFIEAVRLIDSAIWADPKPEYYVLRSEIFKVFNQLAYVFNDYLKLIEFYKRVGENQKLASCYLNIAGLLSVVDGLANFKIAGGNDFLVESDWCFSYLKKASALHHSVAKKIMDSAHSKEDKRIELKKYYFQGIDLK